MIRVNRQRYIANVAPEEIFQVLANIERLPRLLPRIRKVELKNRRQNSAFLALHFHIGKKMFGTIRCEGELKWTEPREVVFTVKKPLPARVVWSITPDHGGVTLSATISLNLEPWLGPLIHIVPQPIVKEMIARELDHALEEVDAQVGLSDYKVCPRPEVCPIRGT